MGINPLISNWAHGDTTTSRQPTTAIALEYKILPLFVIILPVKLEDTQ